MSCGSADEEAGGQRLRDVHKGLPASGVLNGRVHMVYGSYDYYHYMQVRIAIRDQYALQPPCWTETCSMIALLCQGAVQMVNGLFPGRHCACGAYI